MEMVDDHHPAYDLVLTSTLPFNVSRYDLFRGMPDIETRETMWMLSTVFSIVGSLSSAVLALSILSSTRARASSFNLYLVALTLPDLLYAVPCAVECAFKFSGRGIIPTVAMCEFQSFRHMFDGGSIIWMNAVITRELYRLLSKTAALENYVPPSGARVVSQVLAVYAYILVLASMPLWGLPIRVAPLRGLFCMPVEYSPNSTLFLWFLYVPLMAAIPGTDVPKFANL